jgi:hypothetical protein
MFVTFVVVRGHPLAKDLAGGRVRLQAGGDELAAVCRRVAKDTRCRVVAARAVEGAPGDYELTLGGCVAPRPRGLAEAEGTLRVTVRAGAQVLGPRGALPVRLSPKTEV